MAASNFNNIEEPNTELEKLLQLIRHGLTQSPVSAFFESLGLPKTGTWEELLERLRAAIKSGATNFNTLAALLDLNESYGHQHVYLFNTNPDAVDRLKSAEAVKAILDTIGCQLGLNCFDALWLPNEPQIGGVRHSANHLSIKWIEQLNYLELVDTEEDNPEYDLVKKYKLKTQRRVNAFKLNYYNYTAELRIHQLPNSSKYETEKSKYIQRIAPFIDLLQQAQPLDFTKHIVTIPDNPDLARTQRIKLSTPDMATGGYTASTQCGDVTSTAVFSSLDADLRRLSEGKMARFIWAPPLQNTKGISTLMYPDRVAFTTSATKNEVEHVLQGIRNLVC